MDWIFKPAVAMYIRLTNIARFPIVGGFFMIPLAIAIYYAYADLTRAALIGIGATLLLALYFLGGLYFSSKYGWRHVNRLAKRIDEHDLSEIEDKGTTLRLLRGQFGQTCKTLNQALTSLREIVGQVAVSAETIRVAANEIAAGHVNLSQRTEEQAAALEETAAGMEELSGSAKLNAENCQQASGLSKSASEIAEKGAHTVRKVVERMAMIEKSSKNIGDIVGLIEDIAFQTNLLALNASVEAARAGEQGHGFAVVASEVRNLAQRSTQAAKQVKELIKESASDVNVGGELVAEAGEIIDNIVTSVSKVTELIGEIAAASQEQSTGVDQISRTLAQLDDVTQQNASLVEETTAATLAFEAETNRLDSLVKRFKFAGQPQKKASAKPILSKSPAAIKSAAAFPGRPRGVRAS
jgi:methyl-accepting chemotaxis protein